MSQVAGKYFALKLYDNGVFIRLYLNTNLYGFINSKGGGIHIIF